MKLFLLNILVFVPLLFLSQGCANIRFQFTNSYCGGARPTTQVLAKYNTPADFKNFKIKLVGKKTYVLTTDSLGYIHHAIKPGKYEVHLTTEKNTSLFTHYDPNCAQMLKMSYGELEVIKGKKDYSVSLYFPCNPCEPNDKP